MRKWADDPVQPRLSDLRTPKLAALSVIAYFRAVDRLHQFTTDGGDHMLTMTRTNLNRFGISWTPSEADRADAEQILSASTE